MQHFPEWLLFLSWFSLAVAVACALWIVADVIRRPPRMWVMALVWPLTALFGSVAVLWFYRRSRAAEQERGDPPMLPAVSRGTLHCGAGCALGDILVEGAALGLPGLAVAFGFGAWTDERMLALWIPDFLAAYLLGIGFQYFAIRPMREDLSVGGALWQAVKADTLSISCWQIGMYCGMAAAQFLWLRQTYGATATPDVPVFWFVMQVAMLAGFATAWPVNWWLVKTGVKERM